MIVASGASKGLSLCATDHFSSQFCNSRGELTKMVFNGQHICNSSKNTASSIPLKKKRMYRPSKSLEDFSRVIGSNGTLRRPITSHTRNKHPIPNAGKQRESPDEDVDFEKQFGKGRFTDDYDCMWLSLDRLSPPSSFLDNCRSLVSSQFVDEWLSSYLSKVSCGKPDKGATLDLYLSPSGGSKDEEAASWLLMPLENEASSLNLSDDTTGSDNSSTKISPDFDSQNQDLIGANFMLSLRNLDKKDCECTPNTESYQRHNFQLDDTSSSSFLRSSSSSYLVSELMAVQLDFSSENDSSTADFNSVEREPIFWPFEGKFDSDAEETTRYLSMSPRKDVKVRETPKKAITWKLDRRGGVRRQLQFESAGSNSYKGSESSPSAGKSVDKVTTSAPSRFSTKAVPLALGESAVSPKKSPGSERVLFWGEDFTYGFDNELPIEVLLGLSEFDGHEGVEAAFDGDIFFLDESLQRFLA